MVDTLLTDSDGLLWALNVLIHVTILALIGLGCERLVRKSSIARWWLLGAALLLILLSPITVLVSRSLRM
ncbi:MAG: hypothetical protein AAFU85_08235 [Planctomycetota bacterium]